MALVVAKDSGVRLLPTGALGDAKGRVRFGPRLLNECLFRELKQSVREARDSLK